MNTFFLAFVLFAGTAYGQAMDCGDCQANIGPFLAEATTPDALNDVVTDVASEACDVPAEADKCKADIVEAWTEVAKALTGSGKVQDYICQNTVCGPDGATQDISCDDCKGAIADMGATMKADAADIDSQVQPGDDAIADADEAEADKVTDDDVDNVSDDDLDDAADTVDADDQVDDADVDADGDADPDDDATADDDTDAANTLKADDTELDAVKDADVDALLKKKDLSADDMKTIDADWKEANAADDCPDNDECTDAGITYDLLEFLQGDGYCAADASADEDDIADCQDAVEDAFPGVVELLAVKLVDNADDACAAIQAC